MCIFDKKDWPNIYKIEQMDDGWEELYEYYSFRYKTEFLEEDMESNMLDSSDTKTTSACASDPKNAIRIENTRIDA